jgi:hypothetical protein
MEENERTIENYFTAVAEIVRASDFRQVRIPLK